MADDAKSSSILPYGQFVLAALVLLGVVNAVDPLRSSRPDGGISPYNAVPDAQDVPARLWQDPFDAVADEVGAPKSPARHARFVEEVGNQQHGMIQLRNSIATMAVRGRVAMLGVMVPADGFPETQESRRRARYAVVAALHASGYAARDAGQIGYVWTEPPARDNHPDETVALPELVPYEVFVRVDRNRDMANRSSGGGESDATVAVLVLWLDEHSFTKSPQARLQALARQFSEIPAATPAGPPPPIPQVAVTVIAHGARIDPFYILGPVMSETLAAMQDTTTGVSDVACGRSGLPPKPLRLVFLSYSATAASTSAARKQDSTCPVETTVVRTVGDDTALVQALVGELVLRRLLGGPKPDPSGPRSRMRTFLIAYEQDARYSREAALALKEEIENRQEKYCLASCTIHLAGYFRGLDGKEVSGSHPRAEDGADQQRRRKPSGSAEEQVPRNFEAAEGRDQFDYLRRFANEIADQVDDKGAGGSKTVDAVFVFGADTYDRLLLLRAFKERFPHAFYATNDLDARLLQKDQLPWTRNLVIASHFGLELRPELQQDTAPFRSDHQTALYLSALAALAASGEQKADVVVPKLQASFDQWLHAGPAHPIEGVRLSEVGRNGLVQLDANGAGTDASVATPAPAKDAKTRATEHPACSLQTLLEPRACPNVQPRNRLPGSSLVPSFDSAWGGIVLAILVTLGLAVMFARAHRGCRRFLWCLFVGVPGLLLMLIGNAFGAHRRMRWGMVRLIIVRAMRAWPILLTTVVAIATVVFCGQQLRHNSARLDLGVGEPVSFFSGTSFWPLLLVRLVAIAFWIWALLFTWRRFNDLFHGKLDKITPHRWRFLGTWQYHYLARWSGHPSLPVVSSGTPAARFRFRPALMRFFRRAFVEPLEPFRPVPMTPDHRVDVPQLLALYRQRASFAHAWPWLLFVTILFVCSPIPLTMIFGFPTGGSWRDGGDFVPIEGLTLILFVIAAASTSTAAFYQTRRCGAFINALNSHPSAWPERSLEWAADQLGLPQRKRDRLNDYMDFDCVVNCTERMNWFVYPPFVLFALALVNRTALFDAEYFPLPLLAPSILALALTLYVAHRVYEMAEEAKRRAVFKYRQRARSPLPGASRAAMLDADEAEFVAREIEQQRRGAFAPWWKKPWFHSLLLTAAVPLGGSTVDLVKLLVALV